MGLNFVQRGSGRIGWRAFNLAVASTKKSVSSRSSCLRPHKFLPFTPSMKKPAKSSRPHFSFAKVVASSLFAGSALLATQAIAANYGLTANDGAGTSSFTNPLTGAAAGFRLNSSTANAATAPTAGNDYATNAFILRTPANSTSYTFAGNSLTVGTGGRFLFKSTGVTAAATQVITVNNLILSGGVVDLAADGTGANVATLAGNATLSAGTTSFFGALPAQRFTVSSTIGGTGALTIGGPSVNAGGDTGVVILTGTNNFSGATTVAGGTLQLGSGGTTGSLLGTGTVVNNSVLVFNRTNTITQGTDFGRISGTGNLSQIGAGSNLILNDANTFTGQVAIFGGASLSVSSLNSVVGGTASSNLGAPTTAANGTIILGGNNASGTLIYTGTGETSDRAVLLPAASSGSNGVLDQSGTGPLVLTGGINSTNSATHVITLQGSTAGTGEISGVIANGSGLALTKAGTGTWTLSNTNTYAGATTVNGGTLAATSAGALGATANVALNAGGTLLLSAGAATTNNRVNNAATLTLNGGTLALANVAEGGGSAGGLSPDGTVGTGVLTLTANSTIDLQGASLLHIAASGGQIWSGNLSIYNWSGSATGGGLEQLLFGTDDSATSLTTTQLGQILFYSDNGTTFLGNAQFAGLGNGEIVPIAVPEPSTWVLGCLALGMLALCHRNRHAGWFRLQR